MCAPIAAEPLKLWVCRHPTRLRSKEELPSSAEPHDPSTPDYAGRAGQDCLSAVEDPRQQDYGQGADYDDADDPAQERCQAIVAANWPVAHDCLLSFAVMSHLS